MKVAMLSSPMLFQKQGGLQIQILETISALKRRGVDADLIDPSRQMLKDFDLIHVFSAINGNHRIVEYAKAFEVPVITSPLIQPHWNAKLAKKARILERIVGRLTRWDVKTEFRHIESCLANSDHLIALGTTEFHSIRDAFLIPSEGITIVPNGVPSRFFHATPEVVELTKGIRPGFVLNVASINPHKNQLMIAKATASGKWPVVFAGECLLPETNYLDQSLAYPHVQYLGKLNYQDPLLPSIYAAAGVFCLPSQSEVMPLSILEALAAGTPVVTTKNHSIDLMGMQRVLIEVDPNNEREISSAIAHFLNNPPSREECQAAVKNFTWDAVALAIHECYLNVLGGRNVEINN